jgi:predicted RNase H-like HicB family nuclease
MSSRPSSSRTAQDAEECLANLGEAIALILEHTREDSFRAMPPDAKRELFVVG